MHAAKCLNNSTSLARVVVQRYARAKRSPSDNLTGPCEHAFTASKTTSSAFWVRCSDVNRIHTLWNIKRTNSKEVVEIDTRSSHNSTKAAGKICYGSTEDQCTNLI